MKNKLFILIFIMSNVFAADIVDETEKFTSMCIEDNSVGFVWENRDWKRATFKTSKYIMKKVDSSIGCKSEKLAKFDEQVPMQWVTSCYKVSKFGEKYYYDTPCRELWTKWNGNLRLEKVSCDATISGDFIFMPTGMFHRSYMPYDLEKEKEKDSLTISYGKCSKI